MNFLINPIREYGINKSPTNATKDMFKSIILFNIPQIKGERLLSEHDRHEYY